MDCKITIVGAGITGLACAQRIVRDGYTPLVLDKGGASAGA